jgi:hypothetical protein
MRTRTGCSPDRYPSATRRVECDVEEAEVLKFAAAEARGVGVQKRRVRQAERVEGLWCRIGGDYRRVEVADRVVVHLEKRSLRCRQA